MKGQQGFGLLQIILIVAMVALLIQLMMIEQMRLQGDYSRRMQLREMKSQMINNMLEVVRDEMTLRNSRLDVNSIIVKCLGGDPTCLETKLYDLVIFSPTPPYVFTGAWPPPPDGLQRLAGGYTDHFKFYNMAGGPCADTTTEMSSSCPLQAIARIRPLCGGTADAPTYSVPGGGPCLIPVTGFEIIIGIASYWDGSTFFNLDLEQGDQRSFVVSARTFLN